MLNCSFLSHFEFLSGVMTAFLPPNLLALFAPREHLQYLPPLQELPCEKKPWLYIGVAQHLSEFEDPNETPAPTRAETKEERQIRKGKEREERQRAKLDKNQAEWDPASDQNIDGDPFKTLFVARINFDTTESKLRREFETFGAIKKISIITGKAGKPRGYAFIEYEHERDLRSAYKYADGKKIDGKRVVVDVERGRTVKSWRPRKLGGGLGGTRKGGPDECVKYSGRVDARDRNSEREGERDHDDKEKRSERDRDRDNERGDRDRERDKDRDRDHERDRGDRGDHERDRGDRDHERDRGDRDHERDRGDRDHDRERDRDRDRNREKGKERKRDRERSRSRDRDRKRRRSRSRDRGEKEKRRDKDRERDKDKHREKKDKIRSKEEDSVNGVDVREEPMET